MKAVRCQWFHQYCRARTLGDLRAGVRRHATGSAPTGFRLMRRWPRRPWRGLARDTYCPADRGRRLLVRPARPEWHPRRAGPGSPRGHHPERRGRTYTATISGRVCACAAPPAQHRYQGTRALLRHVLPSLNDPMLALTLVYVGSLRLRHRPAQSARNVIPASQDCSTGGARRGH